MVVERQDGGYGLRGIRKDTAFYYQDSSRIIKSIIEYSIIDKDTLKNGPAVYYYVTANVLKRGSFKNDKLYGPWSSYYVDGIPKTTAKSIL